MADDRRLDVLRAIVEDYVATHEPVGSKSLLERHQLGVSPATIRNDMAVLEEEGFITQPHTSAGRIPTEAGYRVFVDRLAEVKPLSPAERRAIETFLGGAVDIDDVIQRSVKVLAQLTNQIAIVQYPSLNLATVRHVEVVPLEHSRMLIVVITSSGRVEQRIIELEESLDDDVLGRVRSRLMPAVAGQRLSEAPLRLAELIDDFDPRHRPIITSIVTAMSHSLTSERSSERIAVGGTANLARFGADFSSAIQPVLEALEEQVVMLKLLGEATVSTQVRIGSETGDQSLSAMSLVSSKYGADAGSSALGTLGPTRMDYPGTIAAVGAVARYVGHILAED
jgi:heat-inducible transcriptional repressor